MDTQQKKLNGLSEGALKTLQTEFIAIGKTRVNSWTAWLVIGLAVGIAAGILFVANRSGEFEVGEAKTKTQRFSDNFNRRDSKELKKGWEVVAGSLEIASNELRTPEKTAKGQNASWGYAVQPKVVGDTQVASARFIPGSVDKNSLTRVGLLLRYQNMQNHYYFYRQVGDERGNDKNIGNDSHLGIAKILDGGQLLDMSSVRVPNPDKKMFFELSAKAEGNTLTLSLDGKEYLSVIDDSFTSGSVGLFMSSAKRNVVHRADDFKATVSVAPKPSIIVISPNGGEVLNYGQPYQIRWNPPANIANVDIMLDRVSAQGDREHIVFSTENDGIYEWKVGLVEGGKVDLGNYRVSIQCLGDNSCFDTSDAPFSIVAAKPSITVISPNGGEVLQKGTMQTIRWASSSGGVGGGGGPGGGISSKSCVSCAAPPPNCSYTGASCESCGTLVCGTIASPNPSTPPVPPLETVSINLYPYHPPCKAEPCPSFPQIIYPIASATTNDGSFEWGVGTTGETIIPDGEYLVEVVNNQTGSSDQSDQPFSIVAASPLLKISSSSNHPKTVIKGVANQKLGAIVLDVTNEPAVVSAATFGISVSNPTGTGTFALQLGDLTNITLVDSSGTVVAGPIDPFADGLGAPRFTFKDIFTVKIGRNEYFLQGSLGVGSTLPEGSKITFVTSTPRQWTAKGQVSGNPVTFPALPVTIITTPVQIVSGSLSVDLDSSTPTGRLATAGATDILITSLRFRASYEAILLQKIGVQFDGTKPASILKVTVWDGATKIGEGVFPGDTKETTIVFPTTARVVIPEDGNKLLMIKADFASIGVTSPAAAGDKVAINYDGAPNYQKTTGVGLTSGTIIVSGNQFDTDAASAILYRSLPQVVKLPVPSLKLSNGNNTLYRFSVGAGKEGAVGLGKFTFRVAPVGVAVSQLQLFAYSDSSFSASAYQQNPIGSSPIPSEGGGEVDAYFTPTVPGTRGAIQIPDGTTRYFELRGAVSGADFNNDTFSISLLGDGAFSGVSSFEKIDTTSYDNFIWSGNSAKISGLEDLDWANGYSVPGLPFAGLSGNIFSF